MTRVERVSSAELVVAVVPKSADHWHGRVLVSIAWGTAAAFAILEFWPGRPPAYALLAQAVVGLLTFASCSLPTVQRWLVAHDAAEQAAHARAFQLFAERGLHATKRRTALLIFVSELERRVVLLGDATIHAELGQSGWQQEVQRLVNRIREGRLRDGLLEVIAELEPRLKTVAPRLPEDENELPDAVLRR